MSTTTTSRIASKLSATDTDRQSLPSSPPERLPSDEVRISVVRAIAAWGFGAAFFNVVSGAIYTSFIRLLSTSDFLFGALAAAWPLTSFLQVMAARIVERTGHRKRQMIVCGIIARALWFVAALMPLLWLRFPDHLSKSGTFYLVLICIATSGLFQAFTGPAFFSWMADLVPERVRPSFFARRMQVGTFVALLVSVAAGLIADNFQRIEWINDHFQPLEVYSILLAIAALAGIADVAMFIGVKEPPPAPRYDVNGEVMPDHRTHQPPLLASLREPLRDPAIRNFLIFVSLLMAGYGLQGAFLWLHALYYLGLSKTVTGIIVSGAPLLGMSCGMPFWSKVIKRYGTRPVMRMCSVGLVFVPIGWITAQPGEWTTIALMTFLSGFLAGAIELSNQNLVTGLSPHVPRATMAALFSIAGGLSFGLASLLGGKLAEFLYGMRQPFMGMTIINYHVLFLCSMLVRIINATIVAPRLREPASTSTLDTVKEIIPEIAQSFADLLTRPIIRNNQEDRRAKNVDRRIATTERRAQVLDRGSQPERRKANSTDRRAISQDRRSDILDRSIVNENTGSKADSD